MFETTLLERIVGRVRAVLRSEFTAKVLEERGGEWRDISLMDVASQVMEEIGERDPDDWNLWHWFRDLFFDDKDLYAITVSAGKLYRWAVTVSGADVSLGEPELVEVEFVPRQEMTIKRAEDGHYYGFGVLCTATLNKKGIIDSRGLFDTFVEHFQGDGSEYINVLHLGGGESRIGEIKAIGRDDKLLWGIYRFDKTPVAEAAARTLAADSDDYWGGSIEFDLNAPPILVAFAEGINLPVTTDGKLLGYSIARNQDCACWYTGNNVHKGKGEYTMNDRDKAVALELLGDQSLVDQLESNLTGTNRTLADAITYMATEGGSSGLPTAGDAPDAETAATTDESGGASAASTAEQPEASAAAAQRSVAAPDGVLRVVTPDQFSELATQVAGMSAQLNGVLERMSQTENRVAGMGAVPEVEIGEEVLDQVRGLVLASPEMGDFVTQLTGLRNDLSRTATELGEQIQNRAAETNGRFESLEGRTTQTEERLGTRVTALEQDEEARWQDHEAAKPPAQTTKVSVRPRQHNRTTGAGVAGDSESAPLSNFAAKARERRVQSRD